MKAQEVIKNWAREEGRKLGWLAKQVPVTQGTMSAWLAGTNIPSRAARARLTDIIGIDLSNEGDWK